ncbi:MAG: hydroxymethylpyrimidine/phosphomethylpyrimidine kinase [Myxococcota bacterium]|nr:hydroxymethylpyrimidine/phosphomethylpyrimidine kinase [Myxococcota bacterium]
MTAMLAIGGLDPTGGAGIVRDAMAARFAGVHCAVVMTTFAIQSGRRFVGSYPLSPHLVRRAIETVLADTPVKAVKLGALGNAKIAGMIADIAQNNPDLQLVVDPVFRSTTQGTLLSEKGVAALKTHLIPQAAMVTPNLIEATALTGIDVATVTDMRSAGEYLVGAGATAVLVKGGHLASDMVADVYVDAEGRFEVFEDRRAMVGEVRGTGCALASLIAAFLARAYPLLSAVTAARGILKDAILNSHHLGPGPRYLNFGSPAQVKTSC